MFLHSKLEGIIQGAVGVIDIDTGILLYKDGRIKELVNYIILTYPNHYEVYLHLFDSGEPPFRDILVKGVNENLHRAKDIAVENLQHELQKYNYH